MWHTAPRLGVSAVPSPCRAGQRGANPRSFHRLPARVAAEFLNTSGEPSRSIAPGSAGTAAPRACEPPLAPGMPQPAPSQAGQGRFTHFLRRFREREEVGEERGTRALCFHICARDVKWICLIEFMTQREAGRGWEVESGGGGIKFAPDFYTGTTEGNAKQPLARG